LREEPLPDQEVARLFQSLKKKAAAAQADPETFRRDFKRRALVEDAQWRAARGQVDDGQLEAELDGIFQCIENNEESLRLGDTKYVSKLLDEVLLEQGPLQHRGRPKEAAKPAPRSPHHRARAAPRRPPGQAVFYGKAR